MNNKFDNKKSTYETTVDQAQNLYEQGVEKAGAAYEQVKESVSDLLDESKKKISEVQGSLHEYSDELTAFVRTKPLTSILIAGGVGFIIAKLFKSK